MKRLYLMITITNRVASRRFVEFYQRFGASQILSALGRGTASMMDQFIVVIEPGARSVQTYERIKSLAKDIGITKVRVVANKIRDDSDREFIRSRIPADDLLGFISYNPDVIDADRKGLSPYDCSPQALEEIRAIKARIDQE